MDNFSPDKLLTNAELNAFNEGLIKHFNVNVDDMECNQKTVSDYLNHAFNLEIVDGVVQYTDDVGDVHELNTSKGVTSGGKWLSSKIPQPTFDVFQGDNVRKAEEASAMYAAITVKVILNDKLYNDEFNEVYAGYDYNNMSNVNGSSFNSLIAEWTKENSVIINIIVSACKYNIVEYKKEEQSFIPTLLDEREATGLYDLIANIKSVTYKYTNRDGKLSNLRVAEYSKIELLQVISLYESEKSSIIESSEFSTLYKLTQLNSTYLGIGLRKKIRLSAQRSILTDCADMNLDESMVNDLTSKARKRITRAAVRSLIKSEILKYTEDRDAYQLPPKQ